MRIALQLPLPGHVIRPVFAELTMAVGPHDDVVIGYLLRDLITLEPLALGCGPSIGRTTAPAEARAVLEALLEAVASLQNWPPFD